MHSEIIQSSVNELIDLTNKKRECLIRLFEFTNRQKVPIETQDLNELNSLINLKQEQIDIINKIDEQFEILFKSIKEKLGIKSFEEISRKDIPGVEVLLTAIQEIQKTIIDIIENEQINSSVARHIQEETKKKIKQFEYSKRVSKGYGIKGGQPPSVYFDKKK